MNAEQGGASAPRVQFLGLQNLSLCPCYVHVRNLSQLYRNTKFGLGSSMIGYMM